MPLCLIEFGPAYSTPRRPVLFSELTRRERLDAEEAVVLQAGGVVRGRLDDAVPRPVIGGVVRVRPLPAGPMQHVAASPSYVAVAADGTFAVPALPPGFYAAVTAVAEGRGSDATEGRAQAAFERALAAESGLPVVGNSLARRPKHLGVAPAFTAGQGVDGVVLPMRRCGGVTLKVRGGFGRPAADCRVLYEVRLAAGLPRGGVVSVPLPAGVGRVVFEGGPTDAEGRAVLTGVPAGRMTAVRIVPRSGPRAGVPLETVRSRIEFDVPPGGRLEGEVLVLSLAD